MSNLPITHPYNSFGAPVDKHIGDAFPAVEAVAKRLQEIVYLANHLTDIQPRDIELKAESPQKEILWRRVGEADWKLLITYQNLLGSDLGTLDAVVQDAIDRIADLERTQDDFWQKTPDPYEEGIMVTSPYYTVVHDGKYYSPNVYAIPFFTGLWEPTQWRDLAELPGQTTNSSIIAGVKRISVTLGGYTENAQTIPLTLDGEEISDTNTFLLEHPGIYEVDMRILAKTDDISSWARLHRGFTLVVTADGNVDMLYLDTPSMDRFVNLDAVLLTITAFGSKLIPYVTGMNGKNLNWTGFISINQTAVI